MSAPTPMIKDLVPQSGSMVLLDQIERWDEDEIVCLSQSHRDLSNPLRRVGMLPSIYGVEYGAQAIAVHGTLTGHDSPGYLAAVNDVQIAVTRLDDISSDLRVTARRLLADAGALIYGFSVVRADNGQRLLDGRISIFLTPGEPR